MCLARQAVVRRMTRDERRSRVRELIAERNGRRCRVCGRELPQRRRSCCGRRECLRYLDARKRDRWIDSIDELTQSIRASRELVGTLHSLCWRSIDDFEAAHRSTGRAITAAKRRIK